jgi:outer membrane protein OmpA-like peptidoglycan-associated protein
MIRCFMRVFWIALITALGGCTSSPLALRHVVLYRSGMGYFERTGQLKENRLRLPLRRHEVDDVLKTLTVLSSDDETTIGAVAALTPRGSEGDVDLELTLSRRGDVTLSYAVPAPSWRSTYKLVLGDQDQALLQSWAIVDNVTDEDWRGVKLILTTGAPFSFAVDLHTPRFTARPDATGQLIQSGPLDVVLSERSRPVASAPEQDSDGDRIPDSRDQCPTEPETYNGFQDEDGCPDKGRVVVSQARLQILDRIYFNTGSRTVEPVVGPLLDAIAATLKENPQLRLIEIQGHAAGNESDAAGLATARALAVRGQLVSRGVPADRLITRGYGTSKPMATGNNEEAWSQNRRVDFRILRREEAEAAPPVPATAGALERSQRTLATALQEVAGMVRYDISVPVSIPRRSSATLSILNRRISGSEVLLFRPDPAVPGSDRHPVRAARFACPPSTTLEPGPIALYARGSYVGDALLGRVHAGDVSLVPFALDGSATVEVESDARLVPQRLVKIDHGVMTIEDRRVRRTRYRISTGQTSPERIIIRHPVQPGYHISKLPAGSEPGEAGHLIPVALRPDSQSTLVVDEEQPEQRTVKLLDGPEIELGLYLSGSQLPAALAERLNGLVALRGELAKVEAEQRQTSQRLEVSSERSAELRDSLKAIEKNASAEKLRRELTGRLAEAIRANDGLSKKLAQLGADRAEKRARLQAALQDLQLEEP